MSEQINLFIEPAETEYPCDTNQVVPLQCPIRVFTNKAGGVSIEQDQHAWYGETVFVAMAGPDVVRAVIKALQSEIGDA